MTPEEENHIRERERTAIWDAKLELLATRDAVIVDPRNWFSHFWFDTHHVEAFLRADPNESHYVIAALCNDPNLRVTCITQNVDNLHRKAGIDPDKLVEIHGRIGYYRCLGEDCTYKSYKYLEAQDLEFFSDQEEEAYYYQVEQLLERDYSLKKIKNICQRLYAMDKHVVGIKKLPCCPECRTPVIPLV
ncbi:Sir2 family regulator [Gregarina niphandrodes]|uniref:Sir2 family regulator n=1 Tax=Gregarina niphandrodes TaxID=110365 RepID=A0A023B1Z3_GRENI|nr:Sir2 family regulator [Gregarina niphandrodes]EZG48701.1 Sir2 family regulator [Gregarina niphandrodes]|eukprot:XP_011132081.1 Sir2 family regulator [Gregarina niphandrodes]